MLEPIGDESLEHAAALLERGFPLRSRADWLGVFERQARLGGNARAAVPRGYLLRHEGRVVGVIVTPASVRRRPDGSRRLVVNLSSWFIDPEHRWRAPMMLRAVVRAHDALYTDLTPSEDVARMLGLLGFVRMSAGTAVHALPLESLGTARAGRVRTFEDAADADLDACTRQLLESHRQAGCLAAVLRTAETTLPLLFVRKRLRGVPAAVLVYCDDHRVLARHMGAVARWLVMRGVLALLTELRPDEGLRGHWRSGGGTRYARGSDADGFFRNRTDYAYSETCLITR